MVATTHARERARQRYGIHLNKYAVSRIDKQVPVPRIRPGMRTKAVVERTVIIRDRVMRVIVNRYDRVIITVLPELAPLFFK